MLWHVYLGASGLRHGQERNEDNESAALAPRDQTMRPIAGNEGRSQCVFALSDVRFGATVSPLLGLHREQIALTPEFPKTYPVKHVFAPHGQHAIKWGISRVP